MWLLWLTAKRLAELAILAVCLFAVPENRMESVVVITGAMIWTHLRHQGLTAEAANRLRMKPLFQMLRLVFARLDRESDGGSYSDLKADFERLQGEVGIGDDAVLSPKYEYLRKPISVAAMRLDIEQGWFDNLVAVHRNTAYTMTESVFALVRLAMIGIAALLLL